MPIMIISPVTNFGHHPLPLTFGCSKTPQPQILTSTTFDDDRYSRYTKSRTQILTKPLTNFFEKSSKVPQKLRKIFQDYIKIVRKRSIKE